MTRGPAPGGLRTLLLLLSLRVRRLGNALFHGTRPPRMRGAPLPVRRALLRSGVSFLLILVTVAPVAFGIGDPASRQRDAASVQVVEVDPPSEGPLEVLRPARLRSVPEPHATGATLPASSLHGQHLVLLALLALLAFTELASAQVDRAPPDLELLAALPLSITTIFTLRVLDESLLSTMGFFELTPGLTAMAWVAGHRWTALPLAVALTPFLVLPLVQLRTVVEVELRTRLDARRLRNVRAALMLAFALGGMLAMAAVIFGGTSPEVAFSRLIQASAPWMWLPPGQALRLMAADSYGSAAGRGAALLAETLAVLALGAWCVQRRAAAGVDPFAVREPGRDRPPPADRAPGRRRLLTPVQAKLATHLGRDWAYLSQALVVPVSIGIFELVLFGAFMSSGSFSLQASSIAAAGLALGAWILSTGLLHTIAAERGTLWLLHAMPRPIERTVAELAAAWGAVAALPTAALLAAALAIRRPPLPEAVALGIAVPLALLLLTAVAACCSLLDGTELADMPQTRASARYGLLFLNVTLPLIGAIWVGRWWYVQAVMLLDTALLWALIQRIRDRAPYFLDPQSEPPRGITLLDALVAVHVYFQVQLVAAVALIRGAGMDALAAFTVASAAGGVITLVLVRVVMHLRGAGRTELAGPGMPPWAGRSAAAEAWLGLKVGLACASAGLAMLWFAVQRDVGGITAQLGGVGPAERAWAFGMAVLVAPWVEEILFRGLLYTGLRRSVGPLVCIAATGALFALLHPAVSALPVLVLGLATGWTRERTGGLLAGAVVHGVFNAVLLAGQVAG